MSQEFGPRSLNPIKIVDFYSIAISQKEMVAHRDILP